MQIKFALLCYILFSIFNISLSTPLTLKYPANHKFKFSFGSCNKFYEDDNSTIFNAVADYRPDLWAWIGDAAYIEDMEIFYFGFSYPGAEVAKRRFQNVKDDPAYKRVLQQNIPIVGTWDNHDYGKDLGDMHFEHKDEVQQIFLDFLEEPINSPRRKQKGVYESHIFKIGDLSVKLILLDVRYFKEPEADEMLGSDQWIWVEEQFREGHDLYLVASGSQVLPEDRILHDIWYQKSTIKLVSLIRKHDVSVILLSGDIHQGEFLKLPCSEELLGYPLLEFTSSGLTHTSGDHFPLGKALHTMLYTYTYSDPYKDWLIDYNFGTIEISYNEKDKLESTIDMHIRDIDGKKAIVRNLKLKQLKRDVNKKLTPLERYPTSLCFNESREERFMKFLSKSIFEPEPLKLIVVYFIATVLLVTIIVLFFKGLCRLCCKRSKQEQKKVKKD